MSTGTLAVLLIFSIPIIAILMGGIQEILKLRTKQEGIGTSTRELEGTIETLADRLSELEAERDELTQRVQNLETIVTSDVWDEHLDADLGLDEAPEAELEVPEDSGTSAADETERLARRIRSK